MEQTYVATFIFFGFIIGFMYMFEAMINIRGIFRIIVALILAYIFYRYGYLIMDHVNDMLYIWTDEALGTPMPQ